MISLVEPALSMGTHWKFMARASRLRALMHLSKSYASRRRSILADCSNPFRRPWRSRRMACAKWSRTGLAALFEGQVHRRPARCRCSGRGMWVRSYVEPWLFRGRIRAGGTPSNRSDDTNVHPRTGGSELQELKGPNQHRSEAGATCTARAEQ